MRKTFWLTCAAAVCAVTTGLATQEPGASTKAKGKTVTVSGCVQRATETGTTGTTGTSGTAAKFELTNAAFAGSAASEATGTSGTAAKTYRLDATDTQLAAHINHKVEVTGTLEEGPASGATAEAPAGTTGSARAATPRLKVESVKMVAATCP